MEKLLKVLALICIHLSTNYLPQHAFAEAGPNSFEVGETFLRDEANLLVFGKPVTIYNKINKEYVVFWNISSPDKTSQSIFAQRYSPTKNKIGNKIQITNIPFYWAYTIAATLNTDLNEYLITWSGRTGPKDELKIYKQLLSGSGELKGVNSLVSEEAGLMPDVAYNNTTKEYLVAWNVARSGSLIIVAKRLDSAAQDISAEPVIIAGATEYGFPKHAKIITNTDNGQYFIVWHEASGASFPRVNSGLFDQNLSKLYNAEIVSNGKYKIYRGVEAVYNPGMKRYAVAWAQELFSPSANDTWGIYIQTLSANNLTKSELPAAVSSPSAFKRKEFRVASIQYVPNRNQYSIAWRAERAATDAASPKAEINLSTINAETKAIIGTEGLLSLNYPHYGSYYAEETIVSSFVYNPEQNIFFACWWELSTAESQSFSLRAEFISPLADGSFASFTPGIPAVPTPVAPGTTDIKAQLKLFKKQRYAMVNCISADSSTAEIQLNLYSSPLKQLNLQSVKLYKKFNNVKLQKAGKAGIKISLNKYSGKFMIAECVNMSKEISESNIRNNLISKKIN